MGLTAAVAGGDPASKTAPPGCPRALSARWCHRGATAMARMKGRTGGRRASAAPKQRCLGWVLKKSIVGQPVLMPSFRSSTARPLIAISYHQKRPSLIVCATLVAAEDAQSFLDAEIPQHPDMVVGELKNGMRYVLFPNKTPPNRFEAHLEVHAGSVDETKEQQGLAHLVEHVTFLGSRKREGLLGTGARSNAYTDFHHTVFHVHSPLVNASTGQRMLPQVLDALEEIAFEPQFLYSRIEKERRAVLSEAQMMNTIEYRVDCQLLKYLHKENALGRRFPIGKTDQIKTWTGDMLKDYWRKWYFPANTTLYVVGELDGGVEGVKTLIEETFGNVPPAEEVAPLQPAGESSGGNGSNGASALVADPSRRRHKIRPPVEHKMGCFELADDEEPAKVDIFKHPLLQHFMLSVFCKLPVQPITKEGGLQYLLMLRTILSVLQFRINARYSQQDPPFMGIEIDISDSGREGCCVSTLTITSEPCDWRGAVRVALEEVRRLQRHGVKPGELERYKDALLRDSEQAADLTDSIPSIDGLDFLMESLALGHIVMDQRAQHAVVVKAAEHIKLEEVNGLARSLLSFASDYGREREVLAEAALNPDEWVHPGPTRATSIVACVPAFMDASGMSTGSGMPMQRGASMATMQHVEVDTMPDVSAMDDDDDLSDYVVPDGAVRFEITEQEIADALMDTSITVEAGVDVEVPDDLVSEEELATIIDARRPSYVPMPGASADDPTTSFDPATKIYQRRLSNGIRVNYVHTDNEPKSAVMRMVVPGGRFCDKLEMGPDGLGASAIGTRALSESGTVGKWSRDQTELFCVSRLINCVLEPSEEFLVMDFNFPVGGGGLKAVLQVLHLFLGDPKWEESSAARAKQIYASSFRTQQKSLEQASVRRLYLSMFGDDHRFMDTTPEEIDALTLDGMVDVVSKQLTTRDMEINIVGDIDPKDVADLVLKYMGTIETPNLQLPAEMPIEFASPPKELRHQVWHLQDSDERACGYIAGPAPSRWGMFGSSTLPTGPPARVVSPPQEPEGPSSNPLAQSFATAIRRAHPLYPSTTLALLTEIINSRLFTTVRDQLGLTYDVSFELFQFDRNPGGWFSVHVTSSPQKIHEAVMASADTLRNVAKQTITERELARAKRTLITRHESDLRTNAHWLGLLTHLQSDKVPLKTVDCLRDIKAMYQSVTIKDVLDAYSRFDFRHDSIWSCIGTSGRMAPPTPTPKPALLQQSQPQTRENQPATAVASGSAAQDQSSFWSTMLSAAQALGKAPKNPSVQDFNRQDPENSVESNTA
ncbi:unnamed protein product [Ostreobium quekettii]|uniref:Uncharacterized protein n=1 Tax=Ostreobium quekettii TaxID=121088 RepID=A0A8S1IPP2_9CHLO|nr:unnamed protein product [Ostreobium quekettii]